MIGDNRKAQAKLEASLLAINTILYEIYHNKSSDEYKMKGDITRAAQYKNIEIMVADLKTLKRFPATSAADIKQMFETLHLPVFKAMVKEYMMEINDRNVAFTAMFTVGYRLLVGELSRIYASTEAVKNGGIVYKPDKVSRKNDATAMIKVYNNDLEKRIDDYIKSMKSSSAPVAESFDIDVVADYEFTQEASVDEIIEKIESVAPWTKLITAGFGALAGILKSVTRFAKSRNPIAEVDYLLMNSYEKTIDQFDGVCALYASTKEAYDQYMKLPEAKRNPSVEKKYTTQLEKYNIKMKDLEKTIEHFNQRAEREADETANTVANKLPPKVPSGDAPKSEENKKPEEPQNQNQDQDDDFQF